MMGIRVVYHVCVLSYNQTTIIWDAHTGEAKQQFPFHSGEHSWSALVVGLGDLKKKIKSLISMFPVL